MTDRKAERSVASIRFIASAGTGKTHQVTSLYSALILGRSYPGEKLGPLEPGAVFAGKYRIPCEQILMLTFARNAASEMRSRIVAEIERQLDRDPDRADFYWSLLRRISGAVISTIHAFGQRLIAQNALALGIAPDFSVLEEDEAERLLRETVSRELRRSLSAGEPGEVESLEELCVARKPARLVAATVEFLRRGESLGLEISLLDPGELLVSPSAPTPGDLRTLEEFYDRLTAGEKPNIGAGRFRDTLAERLAVLSPEAGGEEVAAAAGELLTCCRGAWGSGGMKEVRLEVKSRLEGLAGYPDRCRARQTLFAFLAYAGRAYRAYGEAKRERGVIDFNDLLLRARDLVRERPGVLPELAVIIIDEAQDNSRAQNELVEAIRRQTGAALVLCGDVKQTIHTWRGADPEGMARLADRQELIPVPLQVSYRSQQPVLDWVNEIFRETVWGEEAYGPQAHLHPREGAPVKGEPAVELLLPEWEHRPGMVTVPRKRPVEKAGLELNPADLEALAAVDEATGGIPREEWVRWSEEAKNRVSDEVRAVAERISLLCDPQSGRAFKPARIYDPESGWDNDRACYRYRDITILLRATGRQEHYEAALRERGIPYTGVGKGRGFYFRSEVRDVSSLLRTLAYPRDELALLAVLRSPFCSLSDRAIGVLTAGGAPSRFFPGRAEDREAGATALKRVGLAEEAEDYIRAAEVMAHLGGLSGRWNGTALVRRAVDLTGYDAVLAGSFNGIQRLANLRLLLAQLAERERRDGLDLPALARYLAEEITAGTTAPDAAVLDPSNDAVVISTIHAAKGLSSPVVFIPDLRRPPRYGGSWVMITDRGSGLPGAAGRIRVIGEDEGELDLATADWEEAKETSRTREEEEAKRLFYVAATRGRDLVVLSGENPGRSGSWRDWINRYLLEAPRARALVRTVPYPRLREAAAPPDEARPADAFPTPERLATRGQAVPAPLPESYRLAVTVLSGVPERQSGEGEEEWAQRRREYARTGLINLPPAYLISRGSAEERPNQEEEGRKEPENVLRRRIDVGTFGHAVLERLDFSRPVSGQVREAAAAYGESGGEVEGLDEGLSRAAAAVATLLKGADPTKIIREMPFSARFEHDGASVIVDGAIDLLFFRDGKWRIVDYKFSGRLPTELKKKYGLQLAIYREAVSRPLPGRIEREPLFAEGDGPAPFTMTILAIGPDGKVSAVEIGEEEAGDVPARVIAAARLIREEAAPGSGFDSQAGTPVLT